jgi:hypothetical protein
MLKHIVGICIDLDICFDTDDLGRALVVLLSAGDNLIELILPTPGDHNALGSGHDPDAGHRLLENYSQYGLGRSYGYTYRSDSRATASDHNDLSAGIEVWAFGTQVVWHGTMYLFRQLKR